MDTFKTWQEAFTIAQVRANATKMDVAIRSISTYSHKYKCYVVSFASKNDSDYYKAEIVRPEDK